MDDVEYDNLVEGIRHRKEAVLATLFDLLPAYLVCFYGQDGFIREWCWEVYGESRDVDESMIRVDVEFRAN